MSNTTTGESFPTAYAAAKHELAVALRHTEPLPAELATKLRAFDPEKFAATEQAVAEIAATIPALRAEVNRLDKLACHRCDGTGEYAGASRHFRQGMKFCFACNGRGTRKA